MYKKHLDVFLTVQHELAIY